MGDMQVTIHFEKNDHARWYCAYCDEDVVHQHKPKKPSYEELVTELRMLEERIAKQLTKQYTGMQVLNAIPVPVHAGLRDLLQRVDQGR